MNKPRKINRPPIQRTLTITILTILFLTNTLTMAYAQEDIRLRAIEVLQTNFEYVKKNLTPSYEAVEELSGYSKLRATALLGLMTAYIYLGTQLAEPLQYLNKIAERVNQMVEEQSGIIFGRWSKEDFLKQLAIHRVTIEFLEAHYGITRDERSRANLMKLVDNRISNLGWSIGVSRAYSLLSASSYAVMLYGKAEEPDLREVEAEILNTEFEKLVKETDLFNLLVLSYVLSNLIRYSAESQTFIRNEIIVLWNVTSFYVLPADVGRIKVNADVYETAVITLGVYLTIHEAGKILGEEYRGISERSLKSSEQLAKELIRLWRSDNSLTRHLTQLFTIYSYLPTLEPSTDIINKRIPVYDVLLPLLLERLTRLTTNEDLSRLFADNSVFAVKLLTSGDGYYPIVEEFIEGAEFFNRFAISQFLSLWLVEQSKRITSQIIPEPPIAYYISLLSSLIVLGVLTLLYRMGKLLPPEVREEWPSRRLDWG